ncbi:uncharacterized protein ACNS7B_004734 isoform 2-T2 [Menidia menidia]
MWLRIVIGFTFISKLQGFSDGNFPQSCASMSPVHTRGGTQLRPQTSEPPYEVTCQNGQPGEPITVSLRSIGTQSFRGFMLQARDVSYGAEGRTVGRFSSIETSTTRLLSCNGFTDSAVSHRNNRKKTSVNVSWTPQGEQRLNIIFRATFAEDFFKFWEPVDVPLVQCITSPTMEPTSTQETTASTPTQEAIASTSTQETTALTSTQETTASTSTQETTASTSTQVTTALTSTQETTASTSTQVTTALTSTQDTTASTSTQVTTALTPTQETTASTSTQETTASTPTQETIASTSTQETTASTPTQETTASTSTQETTASTPTPETIASTSTQETTASTPTPEIVASTSTQETTASTPTPEIIASTSTQETTASTSTQETTASTSTPETIASTSTQETTASTSTPETIASTSTQETTASTSTPETIESTSTQETIASTSTANTTGPPPPEQFRTEEATVVMSSKSAWKTAQKATHNIVFFTSPQNRSCFMKVPLVALGSVVLAITSLELVIIGALLLIGPSHELKERFESALRVCFAIDPIFTMSFIFAEVFLLPEEEKRKRTSIHPLLLPLLIACTIWIFFAEIWGFGLCCNRGPILRRVKKESSTHPENCQPQSTKNPFCKVKWFVRAVSVIFMAGTLCFAVAIIVIMM